MQRLRTLFYLSIGAFLLTACPEVDVEAIFEAVSELDGDGDSPVSEEETDFDYCADGSVPDETGACGGGQA